MTVLCDSLLHHAIETRDCIAIRLIAEHFMDQGDALVVGEWALHGCVSWDKAPCVEVMDVFLQWGVDPSADGIYRCVHLADVRLEAGVKALQVMLDHCPPTSVNEILLDSVMRFPVLHRSPDV